MTAESDREQPKGCSQSRSAVWCCLQVVPVLACFSCPCSCDSRHRWLLEDAKKPFRDDSETFSTQFDRMTQEGMNALQANGPRDSGRWWLSRTVVAAALPFGAFSRSRGRCCFHTGRGRLAWMKVSPHEASLVEVAIWAVRFARRFVVGRSSVPLPS